MMKQVRVHSCLLCDKGRIVESRIQHPAELIPDISGFDPCTYTDHRLTGGKLLENRSNKSHGGWEFEILRRERAVPPVGGICSECLLIPMIALLAFNGHVKFDDTYARLVA